MGYFSNGTEGMDYFLRYCANCVHDINEDCPIWAAHLMYSHEACGKKDAAEGILNMLIPLSDNHLYNKECTMFLRKPAIADLLEAEK